MCYLKNFRRGDVWKQPGLTHPILVLNDLGDFVWYDESNLTIYHHKASDYDSKWNRVGADISKLILIYRQRKTKEDWMSDLKNTINK